LPYSIVHSVIIIYPQIIIPTIPLSKTGNVYSEYGSNPATFLCLSKSQDIGFPTS
jgi:hypothetical protein